MKQTLPLHGRTHCPGGADPMPCLDGLFPTTGDTYPVVVASFSDLRGYWRLGETAAPFADTSGYDPADPADLTRHTNGVAMTLDVTGALAGGDDDGAITQNYAGTTSSGNTAADYLSWAATDQRFDFTGLASMTVAAWIKPLASTNTWYGGIIAIWKDGIGASYEGGWALRMSWPTREIIFIRGDAGGSQQASGGVLPADTWTHVAASYDGTNIRLYVNGALADTVASSAAAPIWDDLDVGNTTPHMPGGSSGVAYRGRFYGSLDEVAVWATELTGSQISVLYQAGVTGGIASSGQVLTSDGAGGTTYAYPTVNVDGTRYQEILTGNNLTSTDNGDDTVTLAFDPAIATKWWFPLVDSDGTCVLDSSGALIPTLVPL